MIAKRNAEGAAMDIVFKPVKTEEDVDALAELARGIWLEYWPDRIGLDQTKYMIEMFHSKEAMLRDIGERSYEYWFLEDGLGKVVGYTGGHVEPETNRFFISKIYLLADERGKGYASQTIRFYDELCAERGLGAMYLTVNKHNEMGIRAYKAKGFVTIEEVEMDIGSGYVMDDFVMEKRL